MFCSTSLLLSSTRWVQLSLSSLCLLFWAAPSINLEWNYLGTPSIEPGASGWDARMLPLCFATPLTKLSVFVGDSTNKEQSKKIFLFLSQILIFFLVVVSDCLSRSEFSSAAKWPPGTFSHLWMSQLTRIAISHSCFVDWAIWKKSRALFLDRIDGDMLPLKYKCKTKLDQMCCRKFLIEVYLKPVAWVM